MKTLHEIELELCGQLPSLLISERHAIQEAIRAAEQRGIDRCAEAIKAEWDCAKKYDYCQPYTCTVSGAFEMSRDACRALAQKGE